MKPQVEEADGKEEGKEETVAKEEKAEGTAAGTGGGKDLAEASNQRYIYLYFYSFCQASITASSFLCYKIVLG